MWGGLSRLQPPFRRPSHLTTENPPLAPPGPPSPDWSRYNPHPLHSRTRRHHMVVTLILPKRCAGGSQNPISLMSGKPLQRPQPLRRHNTGRHQHVNVIRHDHERMQFIAAESLLAIANTSNHKPGDLRNPQVSRPNIAFIQNPIHRHETFPHGQERRRKHAAGRQRAMQPKSDKQRLPDQVPMRQPPFVMSHLLMKCSTGTKLLNNL
jgi:hypothetical protein